MLSTTPLHNIQLWKAVVIDPSTEEGRVRFARLKSKGIIQCENDTLENQVAELAIIRNPSLKDNPMGLANAISANNWRKKLGYLWEMGSIPMEWKCGKTITSGVFYRS